MRRCVFACLTAVILCLAACSERSQPTEKKESFFAMDTYITFTAYGENAESALSQAKEKVLELEQLWSVTDEHSEIYAVNHAGGQEVTVSRETAEILSFALDMAGRTGGALEPTIYPVLRSWGFTSNENRIPTKEEIAERLNTVGYDKVNQNGNKVQIPKEMMWNFGAVGKGYAGDGVVGLLKKNGITSALLDIGGNIQAIGLKPDGSEWRLGIRNPFGEGNVGVLCVRDWAVVSSGNYERYFVGEDGRTYGHIIDPSTGYPAESGLISAVVISEEGKLCNALSTALFVMGLDQATDYWRQNGGFDMLLITGDGEIYLTEGIRDSFSLNSYYNHRNVNVIEYEK